MKERVIAYKKKAPKKKTRPTKKPEIKIPDSEARVKRDVSDLEISPYWTLEEFYCFLVGRLDWHWVPLYSDSEDAGSDAGKIKFEDQFSVAHNLGLRLLKAAQNGEIECAGTPPDPFPDSFENKYDKPSERLWNPAALDLRLARESCLRYYAGNKLVISFSLNEVGHGIPKINECLLDNWADALPQETEELDPQSKPQAKNPSKRHEEDNKHKEAARKVAKKLWKEDETLTIADVIRHDDINRVAPNYHERTLRRWIKDLAPSNKPGRRPKKN